MLVIILLREFKHRRDRQPGLPMMMLFLTIFVAGWCVVGGQPGINALAAIHYPAYLAQPESAALGIGRIGAIVGPFFGGQLI